MASQQPVILTTPTVRKIAMEEQVDLSLVAGSGPNGRILKPDLLSYIKTRASNPNIPNTTSVRFNADQTTPNNIVVPPPFIDGRTLMDSSASIALENSTHHQNGSVISFANEKRLNRYRHKCPASTLQRLMRASVQRLYLINRDDTVDIEGRISSLFSVLGSTGNVYSVTIGQVPNCNCPDFVRSQDACKHSLFVLTRVLRVSQTDPVIWQKSLLQKELVDILKYGDTPGTASSLSTSTGATADPVADNRSIIANERVRSEFLSLSGRSSKRAKLDGDECESSSKNEKDPLIDVSNRRPIENGDECAICFEDLIGVAEAKLVWCELPKSSLSSLSMTSVTSFCGKALHCECVDRWLAAIKNKRATCPYCRAPWMNMNTETNNASDNSAVTHHVSYGGQQYLNLWQLQTDEPVRPPDHSLYSNYSHFY